MRYKIIKIFFLIIFQLELFFKFFFQLFFLVLNSRISLQPIICKTADTFSTITPMVLLPSRHFIRAEGAKKSFHSFLDVLYGLLSKGVTFFQKYFGNIFHIFLKLISRKGKEKGFICFIPILSLLLTNTFYPSCYL